MWVRSELKERAKRTLNLNYWKTVLVSLILVVIGGSGGGSASSSASDSYESAAGSSGGISPDINLTILAAVISAIIVALIVALIISLVLSILVYNPLIVGCQRFLISCREQNTSLKEIVFAFSHSYGNVIKIMFLRVLYVSLWSLLFIIPGIIKTYEYYMVPYILAENPEISSKEAFLRSKQMMHGDKWNTFVLELSFLGWDILSLFTCGILSVFYVNPYRYLTLTELYLILKQKLDSSVINTALEWNTNSIEDSKRNPYL